jgi:hypothetical protein
LYYFSKIISYFGKLEQNFELKRVGGAPKDHQFAPLVFPLVTSIREIIYLYLVRANNFEKLV